MPKAMSAHGARLMEYPDIYGINGVIKSSKENNYYIHQGEDRVILSISSDPRNEGIAEVQYDNLSEGFVVRQALTLREYRGQGLSSLLHIYLAKQGKKVLSDRILSASSSRMWKRLMIFPGVQVEYGQRGNPDSPHILTILND